MSRLKRTWFYLKSSARAWDRDNVTIHGAALSYYTAFSIAPLLVIAISVASLFFGQQAIQGEVSKVLSGLVGASAAQGVQAMIRGAATRSNSGWFAGTLGVITLLLGASGVFQQLQQSLNLIWNVRSDPKRGIAEAIRHRILSFSMIGVIAFLLLVSLLASAAVAAIGAFLARKLPGGEALWHVLNSTLSFVVTTLLFSLIFKVLPDVKLTWKDVSIGSAVTAGLFTIGKFLIGLYLGKASVESSYGAAGSLVLLLLWVYYSSLIVFFGAEFTKVYATRAGRTVELKHGAQFVTAANSTPAGAIRAEKAA
jgi:membrane protein